ncbi:hypothetical protein [Burkholderia sp. Bp9143]|uniref:hypothetical protein n=1 Tax=Burkholderia sp. Bp9143 TaxID=2184574 RepID=UPI000F596239|nr:hypothetical protein [Burkholderia sp. Bp9143]
MRYELVGDTQLKDGWRKSIGPANVRLQQAAKVQELQRSAAHRIDPFTPQRTHQVDRLLQRLSLADRGCQPNSTRKRYSRALPP